MKSSTSEPGLTAAFVIVSPQVKTVDILADTTFGEDNEDLKNLKSAFLLFCQGNIVSVI